jgi:adenylate cyclase
MFGESFDRCAAVVSEGAKRQVRRRLAAILFAGYSRLPSGDEADNFASVTRLLSEIIKPQVLKSGGNIIRWTGDGVLIEFDSIIESVRCAADMREAVSRLNRALIPERRVTLRMGINLDDIIAEDGDVFGDGVNIAARLEALAEPGSIFVSEIVRDRVAGRVGFDFEDLGLHNLKNIAKPVRIFRLSAEVVERSAPLGNADIVPAVRMPSFDDRRAIAVLPFANFSSDPEQEFFADGITEDIIMMLAGWRAFPVIARDSTFTYKGQTADIKKVGEDLGVRYVVEGSVRKSGRRVRITAQLIRADTGHHLMAERYDRDLTDLFELQDEIVTTIAGAVEPEILKFERERIASQPQQSEDAYKFYQRGMWHHYRYNKTDNIEAQCYFRRALAIDPHYPQATAALAIVIRTAAYLGWAENPEQNYEESFELAQRAVALDARYPNARFALGLACMYMHQHDRAMAELRQAIELNPSFAAAYANLGHELTYVGRPEETIPLVEKGIRLSPTDPRLFIWLPALAAAHYQLGHYQQAVEFGRRSWTLNRNRPVGLRYVVAGLAQLGKIEEAQAALIELNRLDKNLASFERLARRLFKDGDPVDHILDGLRKAGME